MSFSFALSSPGKTDGSASQEPTKEEERRIRFNWSFVALTGGKEGRKLLAIEREAALKTGDRLKISLQPESGCFVYLLYTSSQEELHLLFPYDLKLFETEHRTDRLYFIPPGDGWFELDNCPGNEIFYLLASAARLYNLERLIQAHGYAEQTDKKTRMKDVLAEIERLHELHRPLKTPAERPLSIVGQVRGLEEALTEPERFLASAAVQVSAGTFFHRIFTIDHQ